MRASADIPEHVPPGLVRDFSLWTSPGMAPAPDGDPHLALKILRGFPRTFYSPNNTVDGRGCWVLTRAEDMRDVLQDGVTFSSQRRLFSALVDADWPLIPLEVDPPDHARYRAMLNPLFSPKRMDRLIAGVRERAIAMIEAIAPRGECEFMEEFAFPFAVSVFLQFLGLPQERLREFVGWGDELLHGSRGSIRKAAARTITNFLLELAEERRKHPADDFMTFVVQAELDGRPLNDTEIIGIGALIFVGGLDTVAAALGFDFNYLARHPEEQTRLRDDPSLIPDAVEEMLRAYPSVHMVRVVTKDVDAAGVSMRAGDHVFCASQIANRDPAEFPDPDRVDFDRESNRHMAFAYGPHRCIGSHLARRELVVGMQEWLARIPPFRLARPPIVHGGMVFGVKSLHLAWG